MNKPTAPWLEDEQRELLSLLVRAHKTLIRAERQDFVLEPSLVRTQGVISRERVREALQNGVVGHGSQPIRREDDLPANWDQDLVYHKGLDSGVMPLLIGDLDALRLQNLLNFRDQTHFFITPDGLRYEASLSVEASVQKDFPMGLTEDRPHPRAFISYTWESDEHIAWVRQLAERLTGDGVLVTLDRWEVHPGDQLSQFMERAVRENDYVLVVCTPAYKRKSDQRQGGVGYEGDVITGELFSGANRRKFIPIHRSGTWKEAAATWLAGSFYVGLDGTPYSEENYNDLINTLHGLRPPPPPVGTPPTNPRPVRAAKGTASVACLGSRHPHRLRRKMSRFGF